MKQFIRYLSLIACVVVVGVWGWSYFRTISFDPSPLYVRPNNFYGRYILLSKGELEISRLYLFRNNQNKKEINIPTLFYILYDSDPDGGIRPGSGFQLVMWRLSVVMARLSVYAIFTPLFLLTLRLWYHPLKAWWRGTDRQGFEVETKPTQEKA